jgi:lactoylglutathione lyase
MFSSSFPARRVADALLLAGALAAISGGMTFSLQGADPAPTFSKAVIDIGVVVSDLDKSAAFYTNVIGFREIPGFEVPPAMGGRIGLTDNRGVKIRVFELGEGEGATKVKLMAFPGSGAAKPDRKFIHSTTGLNYLTLYVSDMTPPLQRLKSAGVKLLGESPVELGGGTKLVTFQDPDGIFIELIGPAKTP